MFGSATKLWLVSQAWRPLFGLFTWKITCEVLTGLILSRLFCFGFFFFFVRTKCLGGIPAMRNSKYFARGKPATTKSRYPPYGACWVFQYFHKTHTHTHIHTQTHTHTHTRTQRHTHTHKQTNTHAHTQSHRRVNYKTKKCKS